MYEVIYKPLAEKDITALDNQVAQRIRNKVESARQDPHRFITALTSEDALKIRAGPWRIFVDIDDQNKRLTIHRIRHRREAYLHHNLKTLPPQS